MKRRLRGSEPLDSPGAEGTVYKGPVSERPWGSSRRPGRSRSLRSVRRGLRAAPWYQLADTSERIVQGRSAWPACGAGLPAAPHTLYASGTRGRGRHLRTGSLMAYKQFCSYVTFCLHTQRSVFLSPHCVNRAHRGSSLPRSLWPSQRQEKQVCA